MFILTNIDVRNDLVQIFDTDDGSNDVVRLSVTAKKIRGNKFKVYGLGRLTSKLRPNAQALEPLGVYVDVIEAREAFATYYQKSGMSRQAARARAGLTG